MGQRALFFVIMVVIVLAGCVPASIGQVQRSQPDAAQPVREPYLDPLGQAAPVGCAIVGNTTFVPMNNADVSAVRQLVRAESMPTRILALRQGSQQWVTHCPVKLIAGPPSPVCAPLSIIDPDGNGSALRIANDGAGLVFKIENTSLGTVRGRLSERFNPHGINEVVWLRGMNATYDIGQPNRYDFYIYMQDVEGLKTYLLEIFDKQDSNCLAQHMPGPKTLCVNVDDGSPCVFASPLTTTPDKIGELQRSMSTTGVGARNYQSRQQTMSGLDGKKQGDTGAGHEPVERVN